MANPLSRISKSILSFKELINLRLHTKMNAKSFMTSLPRLEKAMEELQNNPYFNKYAEKISKLQKEDPDKFMQQIEQREKKIREKEVVDCKYNLTNLNLVQSMQRKSFQGQYTNALRYYTTEVCNHKYVTTPIFYVNAGPHIGHLYSAILADAIARYNSMHGHSVFFCTGTDEHGNKVETAAKNVKLPVDEYCTKISKEFKIMCAKFDVNYSHFIRTTDENHKIAVQHFWNVLEERNHVYLGKYSGWYCLSDEAFVSELDLAERLDSFGNKVKVSADSGNTVEWTEEENYKFRLSSFQDDLKYWLKNENVVKPAKFYKILCNWIDEGSCLEDLSISRPKNRVSWGISTPKNDSQTIYVWFDALINYLTAVGYPNNEFKKCWPPSVQVIGKDILKFHAVYWPAFLMAAGLEPPRTILCHSHWTVDDQKMSKSKGNVISPFQAAEKYTESGLRYFLLREAVPQNDGNYNATTLENIVNAELADSLGNLVTRCTGKSINPWKEVPDPRVYIGLLQSDAACNVRKNLESLHTTAQKCYEEFNLHHVVDAAMSTVQSANQMVNYHEPWKLRKQNTPSANEEVKAVISLALESVRVSALVLYPILPSLMTYLLNFLRVPSNRRSWQDTVPLHLNKSLPEMKNFENENVILFRKIGRNK